MDVSIIIVNFNGLNLTLDCIKSICDKTSEIDYEIIVVDNNSIDGSQKILASDKRIKFIESGDNIGFGKANNLGLNNATGKYVFFLNNDTLLLNNAIKIFYEFCENSGDCLGAVGCILRSIDGDVTHSFAKQITPCSILGSYIVAPFNARLSRKIMGMDIFDNIETGEVGYVTGADIFVNRNVILECGCFDPDFFMYSEEAELQYRFRHKGFINKIIDGPLIIHLEGMSTKSSDSSMPMRKIIMTHESMLLYVKKTSPKWAYYLLKFLFLIVRLPFVIFSKYSLEDKLRYIKSIII